MCLACSRLGLNSWHAALGEGEAQSGGAAGPVGSGGSRFRHLDDDGFTGYPRSAPADGPQEVPPIGSSPVTSVNATGEVDIDSLLARPKWGGGAGTGATIEYSFPGFGATWKSGYGNGEPWTGFAPLNAAQQAAARTALGYWSEVANVRFTEVADTATNVGDIRFGISSAPSTAWAYYPGSYPEGGDVWLGSSGHGGRTDYAQSTYWFHTFIHEIGHALGLKHPHDTGGTGVVQNAAEDWLGTSVMSYRSYIGAPTSGGYTNDFYPSKPMLNDILTIQHLYGANLSTRAGDTTYSWATGAQLFETIWDGGGNDTISWANQSSAAVIRLGAGEWSQLGPAYTWSGGSTPTTLAIAYNVTIENAAGGSGADRLHGNGTGNLLVGNGGTDSVYGGDGADTLEGDAGADRLQGDGGGDRFRGTAAELNGDTIADLGTGDVVEVQGATFGAGAVRFASGQLQADTDGNGSYDLAINLSGLTAPSFQVTAAGSATEIRLGSGSVQPTLSIAPLDADKAEGNVGSTPFTFTVTRSGGASAAVGATWQVIGEGGAPADAGDFADGVLPSGTVSFAAGETSKTVTANIQGDAVFESGGVAEGFRVTLSSPTGGAVLGIATASGSIRNDDVGDDYAGDTSTLGQIAAGGSVTGTIETTGDGDWFRTQLTAGIAYTINLAGVDGGGGSLVDPFLGLFDSSGALLASDDDSGPGFDALLTFTPGATGTYYLGAGAFDGGTGTYRLSLTGSGTPPIIGTDGAETLNGTDGADRIEARGGNDVVYGRAGNDVLLGEAGNDTLAPGLGNDTADGGAGTDSATFFDATAGVTASLLTNSATGGAGSDTLIAVENLAGGAYSDTLTGNDAANTLYGSGGNDTVQGRGGNDLVDGDTGNDVLVGGLGTDRLQGDGGADRFDFDAVGESGLGTGARDIVQDFRRADGDRIDLSTIDANLGVAGDQAFAFRGTSALTGAAQVRYFISGGITVIQVSNDADAAAETEIQLTGAINLLASDLVL